MKRVIQIGFIILMVFLNKIILYAGPFDTGMITFTQPNDKTFIGRIWGDEFIYWAETQTGYRFVKTFDGWYYYATLDANGEYAPTIYKVGIDSPPAGSYQLERSQARLDEITEEIELFNEQIELNRQWFEQLQDEAQGQPVTLKVGILLIEFTDTTHYKTDPQGNRPNGYFTADFDSMMFSINYWYAPNPQFESPHPENELVFGSFRDYWHLMSLGNLKIEGRVVNPTDGNGVPEWLVTDNTQEFYADNQHITENNWDTLADEAITKALIDSLIDTTNTFSQNYFDNIVVIYAGTAKFTGALKVIGGHRPGSNWILLGERSTRRLYFGEQPSFTHIGIYAHEFGHNLGFDDEYVNFSPFMYSAEDGHTDIYNFCLMALGIYNGPLEKGECPATLSPYYRIRSSWVNPDTLIEDVADFIVEYDYSDPNFYCIVPIDATEEEHYIFETKKEKALIYIFRVLLRIQ